MEVSVPANLKKQRDSDRPGMLWELARSRLSLKLVWTSFLKIFLHYL